MNANDSTERRLTDISQQHRAVERAMLGIIREPGLTLDDAIRCSGYDYQDLRSMAERIGVSL